MGGLCCKKKFKGERREHKKPGEDSDSDHEDHDDHHEEGQHEEGREDGAGEAGGEEGGNKKKKKKKSQENLVKLEVTMVMATGLRDADWMGQSDPYCILEIPHPHKKGKMKNVGQSPVIDNNSNPIWNHNFTCRCKMGDALNFSIYDKDMLSDELLGRATVPHGMYYPFGYKGDLRLQDTGEDTWAHLTMSIKVLDAPQQEELEVEEKLDGLCFEENNLIWKRANAVVHAMEQDEGLQREETTSTALETLVRLAESGLPIPKEALFRVVACLKSNDRRYRLAALMICKALGKRVKAFVADIGEALADHDEDVRAGACKVLGTFGDAATPYVSEIGNLLHDEVPTVRSAALESLGILTHTDNLQALVVLGQCLDHEDKRYRLACCLILKAVGVKATPHAYPLAERIEKDTSVDVRIAACGTLGNIGLGAGSVQPALLSLYKAEEEDPDERVRNAAEEAITKLKGRLPPRPGEDKRSVRHPVHAGAKDEPKKRSPSTLTPGKAAPSKRRDSTLSKVSEAGATRRSRSEGATRSKGEASEALNSRANSKAVAKRASIKSRSSTAASLEPTL